MLEIYIEGDQRGVELPVYFCRGLRSEKLPWRALPLAAFIFFQAGASDLDVMGPGFLLGS